MPTANPSNPNYRAAFPAELRAANSQIHLNLAHVTAAAYAGDTATSAWAHTQAKTGRAVVVWWFNDGKPGHANQSFGLVKALRRQYELEVHELAPQSTVNALASLATGVYADGAALPRPDLIIGAGHGTHLSMLAARRAFGGRIVVLMKPSLPLSWFDVCIIPEHDQVARRDNVITTQGVLNAIEAVPSKNPSKGLILLGGVSKHYRWRDGSIMRQIEQIIAQTPHIRWTISDSRRTPESLQRRLRQLDAPNIEFIPHQLTPHGWVPQQMRDAAVIWTSVDSVSMVYEGLTSGADVGVLQLEPRANSRIVRGLRQLESLGRVVTFTQWQQSKDLSQHAEPLNEAQRCAQQIASRYPVVARPV